jgi:dipeptidyl aminopeptidase/acylaminoacyl peptidase
MRRSRRQLIASSTAAVALLGASCSAQAPTATEEIDGLSQPRGLAAADGELCFVEAGAIPAEGPTRSQPGQLEADTGTVTCRSDGGELRRIAAGLPFVYYPDADVTSGAADVLIEGQRHYILSGEATGPNARKILAVGPDGLTLVADLLAAAETRPDDGSGAAASNPWSFVRTPDQSGFYVSEAAAGIVLEAGLDGEVSTFATAPGHEVLTGMAWGPDQRLYVASFGQLPHPEGSGAVIAIDETGQATDVVTGLTMVIDVAFDREGGLLILEYSTPEDEPTGSDAYRDRAGRLLYVASPGDAPELLVESLARPTAMIVVDEDLLISLAEGEEAGGEGRIVRYDLEELR